MIRTFAILCFFVVFSSPAFSQNTNSSTSPVGHPQTSTNSNRAKEATDSERPRTAVTSPKPQARKPSVVPQQVPGSDGVVATFNRLLDGIRHADVDVVTSVYWNSPRLNLFNYNGSVTKGWEQVRKNRESSYPEIKDVKLDVRDVSVTMLGRDGAVVTCQWTQSQNYKGTPESAAGRMTLVFKRIGNAWKAIHLHSSTDTPSPATIPASEQKPAPSPSPSPSPDLLR